MKLKKTELAVLVMTLAFALGTGGYLLGRSDRPGIIEGRALPVVSPSRGEAETAVPALPGNSPSGNAAPSPPSGVSADKLYGRININTASHAELTDLPGIGDALADRIVRYREQNGAFSTAEDLMNVSGIGEKKYEAIKDYITVG